ncbi:hypothetical protein V1226_03710 [Lachnospiraceae bacterium JLR.KK009]
MTITGHNSELGTKSFHDKKKIIRDNSKANILNREVLSAENWDGPSIRNRAKVLSGILIRKFNYVEIHSDVKEGNELSYGNFERFSSGGLFYFKCGQNIYYK